ncbi:MAG: HK97 family phage prohead protease [Parvularculaceae bacterium]
MMSQTALIEGYASVFEMPDLNGDVVAPGAFSASLMRRPAADVKMLYQHAAETPIGRWASLREDSTGLYAVGEILLTSETGREVYELLAGGAIDGLSIGYRTVRAERDRRSGRAGGQNENGAHSRSGRRRIIEADLWEVSVVTFPMADGARVARLGAPRNDGPPRAGVIARNPQGGASLVPGEERLFADAIRGAADILSV